MVGPVHETPFLRETPRAGTEKAEPNLSVQ